MASGDPGNQKNADRSSRTLLFVILAIIIALIAAFLIFRPSPGGPSAPNGTMTGTRSPTGRI